jgi:hypothetical protein
MHVPLLLFWLLAAASCVTYVAMTTEPEPPSFGLSTQQNDLQRFRDRPLCAWGPYLPRLLPRGELPQTAIAKAPPLGSESPTSTSLQEPKQQIVEAPQAKRQVPYPPEGNPAAQVASSTRSALLGAEDEPPKLDLKRNTSTAGKPKPTAKLSSTKKKVIAEWATRKSRFAGRGKGGRGLGLFALSGDFGRFSRD